MEFVLGAFVLMIGVLLGAHISKTNTHVVDRPTHYLVGGAGGVSQSSGRGGGGGSGGI